MLFDPTNADDFEKAKKTIKIGKVVYTIVGVLALVISAKAFDNLGRVNEGEVFVDSIRVALDKIKEKEN
jgi:hypothetical protein